MLENILQYSGSFLGVVGFWMLVGKKSKTRWWGSFVSLFSVSLLIPWAIMTKNYGPIMIWTSVLIGSIVGMKNNVK